MWIIINLDDLTDVSVVKNEDGITMLFSDYDVAYEYAEAYIPVYQIVGIEE